MVVQRLLSRRLIGALAVGLLASCSSGEASTDQSKVTLNFGTEPVVSVAVSEAPASTTPEVAPTTTTIEVVTTTTIDPKAEVEAGYLAVVEARERCNLDPANCDFEAIAVQGSPHDLFTRKTMGVRIDSNLRSIRGVGSFQTRVEKVVIVGDVAFVTACSYDTVALFVIGDPVNAADDIVFDDSKASSRLMWELRRVDGAWLRYSAVELEVMNDGDLCGF
jgi:hypothetical protein